MPDRVTVSIVSHRHGDHVRALLTDLSGCEEIDEIILTLNVPEPELEEQYRSSVRIVSNHAPKGFAANHNAAFALCESPFFAILNPDIRFTTNPFPSLLECLTDRRTALCSPSVVDVHGSPEDHAREFPTPLKLLHKAFGLYDGRVPLDLSSRASQVPWVAGMFILCRSSDFADLGGFDDKFFLYYEDVDLCARVWKQGKAVVVCTAVKVTHDARRASHRNLRHLSWHLASLLRFLYKHSSLRRDSTKRRITSIEADKSLNEPVSSGRH